MRLRQVEPGDEQPRSSIVGARDLAPVAPCARQRFLRQLFGYTRVPGIETESANEARVFAFTEAAKRTVSGFHLLIKDARG